MIVQRPESLPFQMAADRRRGILAALEREGRVIAADLSRLFAVSEDTIRRDLREMADEGLLVRVHGGALPLTPPMPATFAGRETHEPDAKLALARATVSLVKPGQVVLLDGGTTNVEVARQLPRDLRATVVTNSPPVAVALAAHRDVDVVLLGGRVRRDLQAATDAATVSGVRQIRADLCFLGVCAVDASAGVSTGDLDEAYVKRAMVEASGDVVALVTADKVGTALRHVVAPLSALTWLYAHGVPEAAIAPYRAAGIAVTVV
jgi:DeoR/GlpR family transcriptional regulator of sugar metabolism